MHCAGEFSWCLIFTVMYPRCKVTLFNGHQTDRVKQGKYFVNFVLCDDTNASDWLVRGDCTHSAHEGSS